ncbi:MAG: ABC transporter permease [Chloroflexota bacterium]
MKFLRDIWLVFTRYWGLFVGNPVWILIGILQPVLYLLLFAPLLKPLAATTAGFGNGGAYNFFVPGLLIQIGLFSGSGVGFSLIAELRGGVIERLRVTPVSRLALLLGRALRDMITLIVQSLILIVLSVPFGLRINARGTVVMLLLMALIGLLFSSISYALALTLKSEDAFAPLFFTASLPLLLLSGVLLPLTLAPNWLQDVARVNPLYYAVNAGRAIFNNNLGDPSVVIGVLVMAALAAAAAITAGRSFARAIA